MKAGPNLFARLHKWASRQDENYLTESLAVLLEQILIRAPEVAVRLIRELTGRFIELASDDAGAVEIRTQVEFQSARLDLEIRTPHQLVWVEVKAESGLRTGQLEGYRQLIDDSGLAQTRLVLLTRYPEEYGPADARPDYEVRWYQVADWLEDELSATTSASEIAGFLTQQFIDFLRERNMTLTQVGHSMPEGTRALSNLLNMLKEAAASCKVSAKIFANWECLGLKLDNQRYWIGVDYASPERLWFGTRCRIIPEAAQKLGTGAISEDSSVPGRYRWFHSADLDSETVHFFSRTKVSQMQWLESFVRECLTMARLIETPNQPPPQDESEEI